MTVLSPDATRAIELQERRLRRARSGTPPLSERVVADRKTMDRGEMGHELRTELRRAHSGPKWMPMPLTAPDDVVVGFVTPLANA